jgi:hypothetical protein
VNTDTIVRTQTAGEASQAAFEALFDHQPLVDLTRPATLAPSTAERASWRRS